jgi:hypothetical protein
LHCFKVETGERIWVTFQATTGGEAVRWANAFIVQNGDRFFPFNEKGDLIITRLNAIGYDDISRAHLLEPTASAAGRPVLWSHPAYANRHAYARNDKEIMGVELGEADEPNRHFGRRPSSPAWWPSTRPGCPRLRRAAECAPHQADEEARLKSVR